MYNNKGNYDFKKVGKSEILKIFIYFASIRCTFLIEKVILVSNFVKKLLFQFEIDQVHLKV